MLTCEVTFDNLTPTYRPGETVVGSLIVYAEPYEDVAGLNIVVAALSELREGAASTVRSRIPLVDETDIALGAGQHRSFPFEFVCPADVPTYRGEVVSFEHCVEAEVSRPDGVTTVDRRPFVVLQSVAADEVVSVDPSIAVRLERDRLRWYRKFSRLYRFRSFDSSFGPWLFILFLVAALRTLHLTVFSIFLAIPIRHLVGDPAVLVIAAPVALFAGAFVLSSLWTVAEHVLLRQTFRHVEVTAAGAVLDPGGTWVVHVRLQPRKRRTLRSIQFRLLGIAMSRKGDTAVIHDTTHHLPRAHVGPEVLEQGDQFERTFSVAVPYPHESTWLPAVRDKHVKWMASVSLHIRGCPRWVGTHVIAMDPHRYDLDPTRQS